MTYVREMLIAGYDELPRYEYKMRSIMDAGLSAFTDDVRQCRTWDTRLLGILMQARKATGPVSRLAKGKSRIYDVSVTQRMLEGRNVPTTPGIPSVPALPPGLSAEERRHWASQFCRAEEEDAAAWEELEVDLRSYILAVTDVRRELLQARNDLRAQLWAVRLHGQLGDLNGLAIEGRRDEAPSFSSGEQPGPALAEDVEITKLLGGE